MTSSGQDGELAPSEAPPQCPPMAAGWGHLAITSANSVYSGINPAAKVVSLLEVKVRYPEKMLSDQKDRDFFFLLLLAINSTLIMIMR